VKRAISLVLLLSAAMAHAWGDLGHHLVTRTAARLVVDHPLLPKNSEAAKSFAFVSHAKRLMLAHISGVPDTYWRSYDGGLKKEVKFIGDPTHFFDPDLIKGPIPLDYDKLKGKPVGSLPWRAQQFYDLYVAFLKKAPKLSCDEIKKQDLAPSRDALVFAGLLAHFSADVAMPLHASSNFDGQHTGQKGIHWYFESDLVDALESQGLEKKVMDRALALITPLGPSEPHTMVSLRTRALEAYPESGKKNGVAALMLMMVQDSAKESETLLALDKEFAMKEDGDRKNPDEVVAKFEPLLVERLALATALTTDLWVHGWLDAGSPEQCYTWDYAHKPAFVSPDDPKCFGYAKNKTGKKPKYFANDLKNCLRL